MYVGGEVDARRDERRSPKALGVVGLRKGVSVSTNKNSAPISATKNRPTEKV